MLQTWLSLSLLSIETHEVIWLRTLKLLAGHSGAHKEAVLMITEKVDATQEASQQALRGASAEKVIAGYRSKVRANKKRLSR